MTNARQADVIVVGLGAVGSATLYQLARRGVRVIGIDRFSPPHSNGSSHGETRITRLAIGEGEAYSPLAIDSHAIWRELEARTGEQLLLQCGFVSIDGAGGGPIHGKVGYFDTMAAAADRFDIDHEVLDASELRYRFPQFQPAGHERALFEPSGGLVFPERCVAALLDAARSHGATMAVDSPVLSIDAAPGGVAVKTIDAVFHADNVVLSAGGWAPGLAPGRLGAMRLLRQELHWFCANAPTAYSPDRFPTFIWSHGMGQEDSFYGLPTVPGLTAGVKVATEQYSTAVARPEDVDRAVSDARANAMHARHVAGRLAGVRRERLRSVACFYTQAPDGDFVLAADPQDPRVTIVSACSGHGFKHSAGLGALIAARLCDNAAVPVEFMLDRAALRDEITC